MAQPRVGFQDRPLGPFVPGVDEYQAPPGGDRRQPFVHGRVQPVAITARRGMQEDAAATGTPRFVVPAGVHPGIQRVAGQRPCRRLARQLAPVAYVAGEVRVDQPLFRGQRARVAHVRRELDGRVEADVPRIGTFEALYVGQVQLADAVVAAPLAPALRGGARIGQQVRAVDQQHRPAVHLQRAAVAQVRGDVGDEGQVVRGAVLLSDQDLAVAPVPATCPVLVGPAQAERQVDAIVGQPLPQRILHQGATAEPVVVEAERADAVLGCQARLVAHHLRVAQVVEAQIRRQPRLRMAFELRQRPGDVAPFGEALAPPGVVLGERMELRQVERDQGGGQGAGQGCPGVGHMADRRFIGAVQGPDDARRGSRFGRMPARRRRQQPAEALQQAVAPPVASGV